MGLARLPSEFEWEFASESLPIEGSFIERERFHPMPLSQRHPDADAFTDVWRCLEWTRSAYLPYPGFQPPTGALGEYNGKFMCNQFVLRGGFVRDAADHIRRTYRNFFPPDAQWHFMGFRLAGHRGTSTVTMK